ncbi:MAG: hypothetical protein IJW20_05520 [Clostridia bacterium]|nr:hypothetical protein [Clostridia bacterium]
MNADDLRGLVKSYSSKEDEFFDEATETFVQLSRNAIEKKYNEGKWGWMFGCNQLGLTIVDIDYDFKCREVKIGWILHNGKVLGKEYELPTYDQFILKADLTNIEISGFQNEDVLLLKPFVKALQRKGFEVFVDEDNFSLDVALDL